MNKKHIVGYGLTAIGCLGIGLVGSGSGAPPTTAPSTSTVTVTATAAAPTPAAATVTVTAPATTVTDRETETETVTMTQTVDGPTVTETVTAEPPEPEAAIPGDGTFEVGVDIQPGTYISEASGGCYWARLSGSDGFDSIIDNNFGSGQMIVTIKESDRFFETSGCQPWARRSG